MRTAAAASVGPLVRVDGFRGRVLVAFPSSVYVAPPVGHLLVLHDPAHGRTPTSVHVERATLAGIVVGAPAAGHAGHLRVGDVVVDVRQAPVWAPPPPLRRQARPLAAGLGPVDLGLAAAVGEVLAAASGAHANAALVPLVGRGQGLTPAGDDALVGMLAVLHRAAPPDLAGGLLDSLGAALPALLHRTTDVSAHYLRLALAGSFAEPLLGVVDDLAGRGVVRASQLGALLRTGATSGADALSGVVATATWLLRTDLKEVA